jgi:diguanylate cyclase
MAASADYGQARRRAAAVLQALGEHRLAPTPENYRLWYVHLAGEDAALSRAVMQLLAAGEPLDEARCAELYERFFVRVAEERALLNAGKRLSELATELNREVAAFGDETARFGSTLSKARERVDAAPPTGDRIRSIVRGMVEETARMQDQVTQVEGSLRARTAEIDGLRRDLQVAWSEARTDGLTGLANRKHFDQALRLAAGQALEQGGPACLLLADIDHFKQFNDTYGHLLGDQVLRLVANLLRHNVKGQDLVARYGGEEFALILPGVRQDAACTLCERIRREVAAERMQPAGSARPKSLTVSIGVASWPEDGEDGVAVLACADGRLYQAKREGRNRVEGPRTEDPMANPTTQEARPVSEQGLREVSSQPAPRGVP